MDISHQLKLCGKKEVAKVHDQDCLILLHILNAFNYHTTAYKAFNRFILFRYPGDDSDSTSASVRHIFCCCMQSGRLSLLCCTSFIFNILAFSLFHRLPSFSVSASRFRHRPSFKRMATLIDGNATAAQIRIELKDKVKEIQEVYGITPGLAVILVGGRTDSATYVRSKKRACAEVGITSYGYDYDADVSQEELLTKINELNAGMILVMTKYGLHVSFLCLCLVSHTQTRKLTVSWCNYRCLLTSTST